MADLTSSPTVAIENTDWRLSFSPSPSLVTADLSLNPLIWLFVLSGVFGAVWLCILEPRKRLEANVKRMLTAGVLIGRDSDIVLPMSSKRVLAESIIGELSKVLG